MWRKFFAISLTIGSLYFLVSVFISQWSAIRTVDTVDLLAFVLVAAPVYVVTAVQNSLAWTFAFRSMSNDLPLGVGVRIHLVSQIGKYVPGNVGHFVGRLGLLRLENYSVASGSVSIILEILWVIGAAAALSVYALVTGALTGIAQMQGFADWLPIAVLLLALIVPNVMIVVFNQMPLGFRRKLGFEGKIKRPPEATVLGCYALYFLNFLLNGLILLAGVHWLFGESGGDILLVVSLYAVTWLLGFILPGAPGGVGVREALFVVLFGGMYGQGVAAAMAVVLRVVSVVGDLIAFGLGYLSNRVKSAP